MPRYPLTFGMAGVAWRFEGEGPPAPEDYRVESDRGYPVVIAEENPDAPWGWGATEREVGTAKVGGDPSGFWVEFEPGDGGQPAPRFYSVWRIDRNGIAGLDRILMATGPYGGR